MFTLGAGAVPTQQVNQGAAMVTPHFTDERNRGSGGLRAFSQKREAGNRCSRPGFPIPAALRSPPGFQPRFLTPDVDKDTLSWEPGTGLGAQVTAMNDTVEIQVSRELTGQGQRGSEGMIAEISGEPRTGKSWEGEVGAAVVRESPGVGGGPTETRGPARNVPGRGTSSREGPEGRQSPAWPGSREAASGGVDEDAESGGVSRLVPPAILDQNIPFRGQGGILYDVSQHRWSLPTGGT